MNKVNLCIDKCNPDMQVQPGNFFQIGSDVFIMCMGGSNEFNLFCIEDGIPWDGTLNFCGLSIDESLRLIEKSALTSTTLQYLGDCVIHITTE